MSGGTLITAINFGLPLKAMRLLSTEKFDPLPNGHIRPIHPTKMPRIYFQSIWPMNYPAAELRSIKMNFYHI